VKRRQERFEGQVDLHPERLRSIDETLASTDKARRHGWALRGERLRGTTLRSGGSKLRCIFLV
jgi:hypothetical protein